MKIEDRQKYLIVLTIALLALLLGNMIVFKPLAGVWKSRQKAITKLSNQVDEGKKLQINGASIRSEWAEKSAKTLPSNTSQAEQQVLKAFEGWSQESAATITGITPQWKLDSTNYMTLNLRVEATGDLGTLSRLVYDIEQNTIALKLDSVEFSTHDTFGQQLTLGLQLSGLALTTLKKQ